MRKHSTWMALGVLIGLFLDFPASGAAELDPALGRVVAECKNSKEKANGPGKMVWVFKQWHLAPRVLTTPDQANQAKQKDPSEKPQLENQTAIYKQLDRWITEKAVATLVAEGCEGELNEKSKQAFNGWTYEALKKASSEAGYERVLSHVPLKLEARHATGVLTLCGDQEKLIKEQNLAFSDARGTVGFLIRLEEHAKDPQKLKIYMDGAIELYKLPKKTTPEQVKVRLRKELQKTLKRIHATIDRRNKKFAQAIGKAKAKELAVVIGGLHTAGLVDRLSAQGIACRVVEPKGYDNDEGQMLKRLDELVGG